MYSTNQKNLRMRISHEKRFHKNKFDGCLWLPQKIEGASSSNKVYLNRCAVKSNFLAIFRTTISREILSFESDSKQLDRNNCSTQSSSFSAVRLEKSQCIQFGIKLWDYLIRSSVKTKLEAIDNEKRAYCKSLG